MARRSPVQSVHVLPNRAASEPPVTIPSEEPAWKQRAVERSIKTAKLRAAQRVQRFLDAAQAIIIEKGSTDFTVQEVVDRSRQSLRSFYLQFDGKHELLLALFEDALSRSADQIRAATSGPDEPIERLKVAIQLLFESSRPDPTANGRCSPTSPPPSGVPSVRGQDRSRTAARAADRTHGSGQRRRSAACRHQSEADGGHDDADRDVQRGAVQPARSPTTRQRTPSPPTNSGTSAPTDSPPASLNLRRELRSRRRESDLHWAGARSLDRSARMPGHRQDVGG